MTPIFNNSSFWLSYEKCKILKVSTQYPHHTPSPYSPGFNHNMNSNIWCICLVSGTDGGLPRWSRLKQSDTSKHLIENSSVHGRSVRQEEASKLAVKKAGQNEVTDLKHTREPYNTTGTDTGEDEDQILWER